MEQGDDDFPGIQNSSSQSRTSVGDPCGKTDGGGVRGKEMSFSVERLLGKDFLSARHKRGPLNEPLVSHLCSVSSSPRSSPAIPESRFADKETVTSSSYLGSTSMTSSRRSDLSFAPPPSPPPLVSVLFPDQGTVGQRRLFMPYADQSPRYAPYPTAFTSYHARGPSGLFRPVSTAVELDEGPVCCGTSPSGTGASRRCAFGKYKRLYETSATEEARYVGPAGSVGSALGAEKTLPRRLHLNSDLLSIEQMVRGLERHHLPRNTGSTIATFSAASSSSTAITASTADLVL